MNIPEAWNNLFVC